MARGAAKTKAGVAGAVAKSKAAAAASPKRKLRSNSGKPDVNDKVQKKSRTNAANSGKSNVEAEPPQKKRRTNAANIFTPEEAAKKTKGCQLVRIVGADGVVKMKKMLSPCQPRKIVDLLGELTAAQWESVYDIGFGGLVHLRATNVPRGICPWLVEKFDYKSYCLVIDDDKIPITGDDVYDIFMLPRHPGVEVPLYFRRNRMISDEEVRKNFVDKFKEMETLWNVGKDEDEEETYVNSKGEVALKAVLRRLLELKDGGDEFKQLFVIYVCGYLLSPVPAAFVEMTLLVAVEDVSRIKDYDWCSYVIDRLVKTIRSFKENNYSSVSGCLLVLVYSYFHRFSLRGRSASRELPLCKHWPDQDAKARIKEEMKLGRFGLSKRDKSYPITRRELGDVPIYYIPSERQSAAKEAAVKDAEESCSIFMKQFEAIYRSHVQRVVKCFNEDLTDEQLTQGSQKWYNDPVVHQIVDKSCRDLKDRIMEQAVNGTQFDTQASWRKRNLCEVSQFDDVCDIGKDAERDAGEISGNESSDDDVENVYSEERPVSRGVDKDDTPDDNLVADLGATNEVFNVEKVVDIEKQNTGVDLDIGNNVQNIDIVKENIGNDQNTSNVKAVDNEKVDDAGVADQNMDKTDQNIGKNVLPDDVSEAAKVVDEVLSSQDNVLKASDIYEDTTFDNLSCFVECGDPRPDVVLGSKVLRNNVKYVKNMLWKRKEVADYVYFMSEVVRTVGDNPEIFVYMSSSLTIGCLDIRSMQPQVKIESTVVDCWVRNLNYTERLYRPNKMERFWFHTGVSRPWHHLAKVFCDDAGIKIYNVYGAKNFSKDFQSIMKVAVENIVGEDYDLSSVKMFFFPMGFNQHYTCFVVNMELNRVQYLDNRETDPEIVDSFYKILIQEFSIFVDGKSTFGGGDVSKFELEKIPFDWIKTQIDTDDCGVYLMKHMQLFHGKKFDFPAFNKVSSRHVLRAEIIASLCLSDANQRRVGLLKRVDAFIVKKGQVAQSKKAIHAELRRYYDAILKNKLAVEKHEREERQKKRKEEQDRLAAENQRLLDEGIRASEAVANEGAVNNDSDDFVKS